MTLAMIDTAMDSTAFDKFEKLVTGYAMEAGPYQSTWPGLSFDPRGAAKLSAIAGWLTGLKMGGNAEVAYKLADDLDRQLTRLANYGAELEIAVDGGKQTVTAPSFRVVLGDDGIFGSFTIAWFRAVTIEQIHKKAAEIAGSDDFEWQVVDQAKEKLSLRKELEQSRHYTPEWVQERLDTIKAEGGDRWAPENSHLGISREFIYYGYAFNGGLIMHGMGNETFSVDTSGDSGPRWSVHT